jgi:hypothetical protein
MVKNLIWFMLILISISKLCGQNALITYEVRVGSIQSGEGSSLNSCSCYETGDEEYTAKIRVDHSGSTGTSECMTKTNNGNATYGQGTVLKNASNTSARSFTVVYDIFENDAGDRCTYNSGDDCRANGSYTIDFFDWALPSSSYYHNYHKQVYNCGSSYHYINLVYGWRYSGTNSSISPQCDTQSTFYSSGDIRSWSVYMYSGLTYYFSTVGGTTEDTYLRLYNANGGQFGSNDDYNSLQSQMGYYCTTTGWYYVELAHKSRTNLTNNGNLKYWHNTKTGSSFANPFNTSTLTCINYPSSNANTPDKGYCDDYGNPSADMYYKFTVLGTTNTFVDLSTEGSGFDTYIWLLDANGNLLQQNNDNGPIVSGQEASIRTSLAPGIYYLVVEGNGNNTGTIKTTIRLTSPTIGTMTTPATICTNSMYNIFSVDTVNFANRFSWSLPSSVTANGSIINKSVSLNWGSYGSTLQFRAYNGSTDNCYSYVSKYISPTYSPASAVAHSDTSCSPDSLQLFVSGVPQKCITNWYDNPYSNSILPGGNATDTFNTPVLSSNTIYYVETLDTTTGCKSASRQIVWAYLNKSLGGNTSTITNNCFLGDSTTSIDLAGNYGSVVGWQKKWNDNDWSDITNTDSTYSEVPEFAGFWKYRAKIRYENCRDTISGETIIWVNYKTNIWNGTQNSDWSNPLNWSLNQTPKPIHQVKIPASTPHSPILQTEEIITNLIIDTLGELTISPAGKLNVQDSLLNAGNIQLSSNQTDSGCVFVEGQIIGNGKIQGLGLCVLKGKHNQKIKGGIYNNLIINKDSMAILESDATILGTIKCKSGALNLNGHCISLGTNARLEETENSFIFGENGSIETTLDLNQPNELNICGIGIGITSAANLGTTSIIRHHSSLSGSEASQSINRWYDIVSQNNNALNAQLTFQYLPHELNGIDEHNLLLFKSNDIGQTWIQIPTLVDTFNNSLTVENLNSFSRWTAWSSGSENNTLPVIWYSIDAQRTRNNCNEISWSTASEINSDIFVVEKSFDGYQFFKIAEIQSAGNSNHLHSYNHNDTNRTTEFCFYRIKQIDFDGGFTYSKVVAVKDLKTYFETTLYPNPSRDLINIELPFKDNWTISIFDGLGKEVFRKSMKNNANITVDVSKFKAGKYEVMLENGIQKHSNTFIKL